MSHFRGITEQWIACRGSLGGVVAVCRSSGRPHTGYLLGHTLMRTPILPVLSHVTWGQLLIFSDLLIPHRKNGDNNPSQG